MWVLELIAVATSNNRQWRHCQSQWEQLKPSQIAMDAINAFIVRRQSAHERSPSNTTRKAVAINLKATQRPCQQMQQGRCEDVVSIKTIPIPRWQILPQGHQLPQRVCNKCNLRCFADQCRSQGSYARHNDGNYPHHQHGWREWHKLPDDSRRSNNNHNSKKSLPECKDKGFQLCHLHGKHTNHLYDECHANPCNQACKLQQQAQTTTTKTQPWQHMHHASCAQQLLDKQRIKLPGWAGDNVFSDKKTSASKTTKSTILLVQLQK